MNREEALKARQQLENSIKENAHKTLAISNDLCEVSKTLSGIDAKIATLEHNKSDTPISQRSERIELCKLGIILISAGLIIAILIYFTSKTDDYIKLITFAIIAMICAGLLCGYFLWSNSQALKHDLEIDEEIKNIKNSTNELINKRIDLQNQLEAITIETLNNIQKLRKLTNVK